MKKRTIYICPMHEEVSSVKPGKCPKCGMALVKKNETEHKKIDHSTHDHSEHHRMMAEDFKRQAMPGNSC